MAKSYWKHPLLVNPSKWLTIERAHAPQLYQTGYYDTTALKSNPFALGLLQLIDNTTATATANTLIPLVVQPDRTSLSSEYYTIPSIKSISQQIVDRDHELGTIGHIPNNKQLVSNVQKRQSHKQYCPEEIRFLSSPTSRRIGMLPRFPDLVSQELQEAIHRSLPTAIIQHPITQDILSEGQGLILSTQQFFDKENVPRYTGIHYRHSTPVVCLGNLINLDGLDLPEESLGELYLPFCGNTDLCYYILTFADYNKSTPCQPTSEP